jgi:hypothetical protein
VFFVRGWELLRGRHNAAASVRGRHMGCRWQRRDALRRMDELRAGRACDVGRYGDDESHVCAVLGWNVFDHAQRKLLHGVDDVRARYLREHGRHDIERSGLYGMRRRDVFVDLEPELLPFVLRVRRRYRANRTGYRDKPSGVFGLPGRYLLPWRHHP